MTTALITGGTGHIGAALVERFCAHDVKVAFTYLTREEQASALVEKTGATAIQCDLNEPGAADALVASCGVAHGETPQYLIDTATPRIAKGASDEEQLTYHHRVRVVATHAMIAAWHAAAPARGEALLLSSMPGVLDVAGPLCWSVSNAARWGLVRGLKRPLGVDGLRINLVVLGVTDGGISDGLTHEERAAYLKYAAYRRGQTANEVARFIASWCATNTYATGTRIVASGGL